MTTQTQEILDFYTRPAAMTSAGAHAPRFDELPGDVASLVRVVQGLLLHQHWAQAYGVELPDERRDESHLRPADRMLDRLLARDERPLSAARALDARLVGVCRHFTVLLVALLRAKGIPARARCGFGGYFHPGDFVDHWVCEHWNAAEARWVLVDAQIDDVQREALKLDFDVLDVPRDRFLIAGDAWSQCRAGEADPSKFGCLDMRGLWFIDGNVVRDLAALNNMEMLPWDDWGAMSGPDEPLREEQLALFDRLAAITRSPDARFAELRQLYEGDERLRVPATVFNAVLNRPETV
ncbi:transglutaminase-like domain-containing protein [Sorangium sp. So ce1078]|uniref:transglutaminase-like domain-containing protein n=1 Tax=Sorangium sp. So ce1078 TaxID=3133329 RepID=UPI003F6218D1